MGDKGLEDIKGILAGLGGAVGNVKPKAKATVPEPDVIEPAPEQPEAELSKAVEENPIGLSREEMGRIVIDPALYEQWKEAMRRGLASQKAAEEAKRGKKLKHHPRPQPEQLPLIASESYRGLTRQEKILAAAKAILGEDAQQSGSLGYIARLLAQVGLPHSEMKVPVDYRTSKDGKAQTYIRSNGEVEVRINSLHGAGIPYGVIPRVLLAYVSTEAVRTKSRNIHLGKNLSQFLEIHLDLPPTGGVNGSITRVKDQAWRLFGSGISIIGERTETQKRRDAAFINVSDKIKQEQVDGEPPRIWSPLEAHQSQVWDTNLVLNDLFYQGIIERPVPVDWRAIRALKKSSLALDIYFWLTHRMSYLSKRTTVAWHGDGSLQVQMGAQYDDSAQGRYAFKKAFEEQLRNVLTLYPAAKVESIETGLILRPSKLHVPRQEPSS